MESRSTNQLDRARVAARILDAAIRIPGTDIRIGLDPILGLFPGLGDVAGASVAGYTILLGARLGAPTSVILRMLLNVGIDTLIGAVPFLGDLFDFGWKSNIRNVALLERYLEAPRPTRTSSRAIVAGVMAALIGVAAGGIALAALVVRTLLQALS